MRFLSAHGRIEQRPTGQVPAVSPGDPGRHLSVRQVWLLGCNAGDVL
jgi:hypothetical protein